MGSVSTTGAATLGGIFNYNMKLISDTVVQSGDISWIVSVLVLAPDSSVQVVICDRDKALLNLVCVMNLGGPQSSTVVMD